MYVSMYEYVCRYVCMYVSMSLCVRIYVCMYVCMYVCVCVCVSSYVLSVKVLSAWRSARIFFAADNSQGLIEVLSICRSWVVLRGSLGGHRASWG